MPTTAGILYYLNPTETMSVAMMTTNTTKVTYASPIDMPDAVEAVKAAGKEEQVGVAVEV